MRDDGRGFSCSQSGSARGFHQRCNGAEFELDGLVAPQLFEVVVLANRWLHDVCHSSAAIDDDPLAVLLAFDAGFAETGFTHGIAHAGGQCLGLAIRRARSHDDTLKQRGDVLGVKDLNVLRLHILQAIDNGSLQFLNVFFVGAVGVVGHAVVLKKKLGGLDTAHGVKYNALLRPEPVRRDLAARYLGRRSERQLTGESPLR